ncbi:MAG: M48 family metallopeptidase [Candidatus Cloacimonadales bacterium]
MRQERKFLAGIGSILFVCDSRNRQIRLSFRPARGFRVSYPPGTAQQQVEKFVYQHQIALQKLATQHATNLPQPQIQRLAAENFLRQRLLFLSAKHGFVYNKVSFRLQKTRWGSCSIQNNLSLNLQIFLLPADLQDYILLHELLHTKIKNHSSYFWQELQKILPAALELNRQLKKYPLQDCQII